jgi:hypothetical protein
MDIIKNTKNTLPNKNSKRLEIIIIIILKKKKKTDPIM